METRTYTPIRLILLILAVLCFLLGMFNVGLPINVVDLGFALFAGAFLVPVTAVA